MASSLKRTFLALILTGCAASMAAATVNWDFLPETAGSIGNVTISKAEVIERIKQNFTDRELVRMSPDKLHTASEIVVSSKLDRIAVLALMKDSSITPDAERVMRNFKILLASMTPEAKRLLTEKLKKNNVSVELYEKRLARNPEERFRAAFAAWMKKDILTKTTVSRTEIENFYRRNQQDFAQPEKAQLQCIVISKGTTIDTQLKAKNTAEEISALLKQGMPFELLIKKYCPDGAKTITISKNKDPKKMTPSAIAAFKLAKSEVSELIETPRAFYLIKMIKRIDAGYVSVDKAAGVIKLKLQKAKADELVQKLVAGKRRELNGRIFF